MTPATPSGANVGMIASDAELEGRHDEAWAIRSQSNWNYTAIIVGPPGCGKTTLAATIVRRHLATTGGIVFAHDPVFQFSKHGCHSYSDVDAWRRAADDAARKGAAPSFPRGAAIGGEAEAITRLALELGAKVNSADDVRLPILVVYDEGSLLGSSGTTFVGAIDNELLATRRHRGVAPVFNLQQPSQLTERFWTMSTDAYVFRQTSDRARMLDQLLLLEKGDLGRAGATRLPAHHYIHVRVGEGIVDGAL